MAYKVCRNLGYVLVENKWYSWPQDATVKNPWNQKTSGMAKEGTARSTQMLKYHFSLAEVLEAVLFQGQLRPLCCHEQRPSCTHQPEKLPVTFFPPWDSATNVWAPLPSVAPCLLRLWDRWRQRDLEKDTFTYSCLIENNSSNVKIA